MSNGSIGDADLTASSYKNNAIFLIKSISLKEF